MRIQIAKSQFIHNGTEYIPGDPIRFADEDEADRFSSLNLVSSPLPEYHRNVTPATEGDRLIVNRGGGWYDVIEADGTLVEETIQGRDAAESAAREDEAPGEGEAPDDEE